MLFIIKNWSRTIIFSQHVETKKLCHDLFFSLIDFSMFDFSIKRFKLFITTLHVCVLYLCDTSMYIYTIYILTYTKICTEDLMEMYKSFQDQNISQLQWHKRKSLILLCSTWNCLGNSNFNVLFFFFFKNLIKCQKWKN